MHRLAATGGSIIASFSYCADDRRAKLTLPDGIVATCSYDTAARRAKIGGCLACFNVPDVASINIALCHGFGRLPILCLVRCCRRLFGFKTFIKVILLAVHTVLVIHLRQDAHVLNEIISCKVFWC